MQTGPSTYPNNIPLGGWTTHPFPRFAPALRQPMVPVPVLWLPSPTRVERPRFPLAQRPQQRVPETQAGPLRVPVGRVPPTRVPRLFPANGPPRREHGEHRSFRVRFDRRSPPRHSSSPRGRSRHSSHRSSSNRSRSSAYAARLRAFLAEAMDPQNQPMRKHPASKEQMAGLTRRQATEIELAKQKCAICLEQYDKERSIITMDCGHSFDEPCLINWLKIKNTCPLCRVQMKKDSSEKGKDESPSPMDMDIDEPMPTPTLEAPAPASIVQDVLQVMAEEVGYGPVRREQTAGQSLSPRNTTMEEIDQSVNSAIDLYHDSSNQVTGLYVLPLPLLSPNMSGNLMDSVHSAIDTRLSSHTSHGPSSGNDSPLRPYTPPGYTPPGSPPRTSPEFGAQSSVL